MFPAGEGRVYVSMDFAAQELVITACTALDEVMLNAFQQEPRLDVHGLTASSIARYCCRAWGTVAGPDELRAVHGGSAQRRPPHQEGVPGRA